jgi:alpha,alpha-trehalose phosphorylase
MTPDAIQRQLFDAVLFDLDGVLTATAALHARCWKVAFDELPIEPFDVERDYVTHVDGKPRHDGVRDFLASRGIASSEEQVSALADRKQRLVEHALRSEGVNAFPGSVRWVRQLRESGVRTAVVSSSANANDVLAAAGIDDLFETTVHGGDMLALGLRGKPAPDGFLEAARRLGVAPKRAVVVEDAIAGVVAGRAGGFHAVIGVSRGAAPGDLLSAGADLVVHDLEELLA